MEPTKKSPQFPTAKVTALARLKTLTDTMTSRRPSSDIVFPPPSWEIDKLVLDSNYGWDRSKLEASSRTPEEEEAVANSGETVVSTEASGPASPEPLTFARKLRELIEALPLPSAFTPSQKPSVESPETEAVEAEVSPAGPPVPPGVDEDMVTLLSSEGVMNGTERERGEEGKDNQSIWNILSQMRWKGKGKETTGLPDTHEQGGLMVYAPLQPTNDSTVELAEICSTNDVSTPPGSPVPDQPIKWVPSTTQLSVYTTWWGYRLYLPPATMATLDSVSLTATAQAAMVTSALKWLLNKVPTTIVPVQFRPGLVLLKRLGPVVGYVGVFVAWSWGRIKKHDNGNGVVLTATWLLPVALIPAPWDAGDIYGPVLLPKPEDRKAPPLSQDKEQETKRKWYWLS
ncbi:hypothetical protein Agabi119p4_418 [Agaricus bisporus var. burnettii]|uniref:Uncharacterized protein n=1 Tax=Agaricus bisporus var. burnettii TaxID=192524 RepID=A0A8H7KKQ5_AGABI|nr:hypothetical protein Agabi119p4_418 [Agaricus bisporus var. burnettii]